VFRDGRLIGHGGLNFVPEFAATEVLWALHPNAWGKGYATEVAEAALAHGFEALGLETIFAITLASNTASQAVMQRIGLTYRRRVDYKGFTDLVWFDVDRTAYRSRFVDRC
jgi:RimJ/RimL family protein N-acetyltransferase